MKRGDVVLLDYPYADGSGSKVRPVLIVQNDLDNQRLTNTIVALITKNVSRVHEPTQLLIDMSTTEGQHSGLNQTSAVTCGQSVHGGPDEGSPCGRQSVTDDDDSDQRLPESGARAAMKRRRESLPGRNHSPALSNDTCAATVVSWASSAADRRVADEVHISSSRGVPDTQALERKAPLLRPVRSGKILMAKRFQTQCSGHPLR